MQAVLFLVLATAAAPCAARLQLELVSLVFRHGDRAPVYIYPNDPNINSWPQGLGQLTIRGLQQQYFLGGLLRRLYVDSGFLDGNYSTNQFVMRSTDVDRTLMSAQSQLAALFFPTPTQQFNRTILWQPIPVHTVPLSEDFLLRGYDPGVCPFMYQLIAESMQTMKYKKVEHENEALLKELSEYFRRNVTMTSQMVYLLFDTLSVELIHNLTVSNWFSPTRLEKLRRLQEYFLGLLYDTDEKKRIGGGLWGKTVIDNMVAKANGSLSDRKMFSYSAHDTTVAAMLSVFNMYNWMQPPYASVFIIELYNDTDSNKYFVKFLYRNDTYSSDIVELTLLGCGQPCPLDEVKRIMAPYLITLEEVKEKCGVLSSNNVNSSIDTVYILLAVLLVVTTIITLIIIALVVLLVNIRKQDINYHTMPVNIQKDTTT